MPAGEPRIHCFRFRLRSNRRAESINSISRSHRIAFPGQCLLISICGCLRQQFGQPFRFVYFSDRQTERIDGSNLCTSAAGRGMKSLTNRRLGSISLRLNLSIPNRFELAGSARHPPALSLHSILFLAISRVQRKSKQLVAALSAITAKYPQQNIPRNWDIGPKLWRLRPFHLSNVSEIYVTCQEPSVRFGFPLRFQCLFSVTSQAILFLSHALDFSETK
jgi:hypothetical protein